MRLPAGLWQGLKWGAALAYSALLLGSTTHHWGDPGHWSVILFGLECAGLVTLLWRAKSPVWALVTMAGLLVACDAVAWRPVDSVRFTLLALVTYSLFVRRPLRRAVPLVLSAWVAVSGADLAAGSALVTPLVPNLVLLVAAVATSLYVGSQRALLAAAHERAEQAERERNYHAERAVAQERVRIARELHDVVAHHVSLLVVQAGAVRENLGPEHPAREILDSMIHGGRQAMGELRSMLGALRGTGADGAAGISAASMTVGGRPPLSWNGGAAAAAAELAFAGDPNGAPRAPQPSLVDIGALIEGAEMAGLPVRLEMRGLPDQLPPAVGLAAYRITQEALTNIVKHAPGAETSVTIEHQADGVWVRVRNGRPVIPVTSVPGQAGQGLLGMAERAAHCHGWVKAEPDEPAGEGFTVEAWLPVAGS